MVYAAIYNPQRAFVIIFLIYSDLLSYLRIVDIIVVATVSGQNSLKVIFTKKFLTETVKAAKFCFFDVFSVRPPQKFQVLAKISTIQRVFADYLKKDYSRRNSSRALENLIKMLIIL